MGVDQEVWGLAFKFQDLQAFPIAKRAGGSPKGFNCRMGGLPHYGAVHGLSQEAGMIVAQLGGKVFGK